MPIKKRGIRGKKGLRNTGDVIEHRDIIEQRPPATNINVTVKEKESSGGFFSEPFGDVGKTLATLVKIGGFLIILWLVFFVFTDYGQVGYTAARVGFQDAISIVTTTIGNIRTGLTDPGGTFGTWEHPDAIRVGPKDRGVQITNVIAKRNYEQGEEAVVDATITIKNVDDLQLLPLTLSCRMKTVDTGTGLEIPEYITGKVTALQFGKTTPAEEQDIIIPGEFLDLQGGEYTFTASCIIPPEASQGIVYQGQNTILARQVEFIADYDAQSQAFLKVLTYNDLYSQQQLANVQQVLQAQGVSSQNGRLSAQTQGGALNLQVDLQAQQPITPLSFPVPEGEARIIPLAIGLTDDRGWAGSLHELHSIEIIRIPHQIAIDQQTCEDFTGGTNRASLKRDIIDRVNFCIQEREQGITESCSYDPARLRNAFSCSVRLLAFNTELAAQDIVVQGEYTYRVSRLGAVNYIKNTD